MKAIRLDRNYAIAYYEKGFCLDNLGKYKDAIASYDAVGFKFN